jgi:hypothetical protein
MGRHIRGVVSTVSSGSDVAFGTVARSRVEGSHGEFNVQCNHAGILEDQPTTAQKAVQGQCT